ncbi:transcriptional regulator [Pantoea ananatis 15320]|uniref:MarR family winged helix-turn-helix transcriptional regulator n=1 Tax=Pantoea ananas TaxID=553 RepID=UPI001EE5AC3F|nr:MarR family transcriptional regulator [Pantoea ananatis]PKC38624.1 transcriptional regulator [Pantoea ananatis 15320]
MNNELSNLFFHLTRQLLQKHTALWQEAMPFLTKQQYAVLSAVHAKPGIEQLELTEAALSSKATLAELLVRMEHKGLIQREEGKKDKRRRFVTLTDQGEEMLNTASPIAESVDSHFLNRLEDHEQKEIISLLKIMLKKQAS